LVGSVSPTQTLTVTNNGTANVPLAPITASGDFQIASQCSTSASLRPGDSCLVSVSFAPSAKGGRAGTLTVSSRNGKISAQTSLSGTGTVPSPVNGAILSPANLFFGGEPINQPSQAQTITVTNPNASTALTISSITAGGDFSEVTNCPTSLPANGHCVINVTVTPSTVGSRTGTLTVTDNIGTHLVAISALGQAASAVLTPTHLAFGSQPIPGSNVTYNGTAQIATLVNSGSADLKISSIRISGDFSQTNTCGSSLAAGSSCTIAIAFAPTDLGHRTGTLIISDNAADASSQQQVAVEGDGSVNGLVLAPPLLRFGTVPVGQTSESQTSILTNGTGQPITGLAITASGEFAEIDNCGSTLANGANCRVTVTMTPAISGAATGSISFSGSFSSTSGGVSGTGAAGEFEQDDEMPHVEPVRYVINRSASYPSPRFREQPRAIAELYRLIAATHARSAASLPLFATLNDLASVALSGAGSSAAKSDSAPSLHASPGIMSWSTGMAVGHESSPQTITLTNSGKQALTGIGISSSSEFPITANQCGTVLAGGASCTISVLFQPASTGPRAGMLSITGAGGISDSVPLNATGSDFTIAAAAGAPLLSAGSSVQIPLALNSVAGDSQTVTLTCTVSGGATCSVAPASVSLAGPAAAVAQLTVISSAASVPWPGAGNARWPWAFAATGIVALALWLLLADASERRRRWKAALVGCALTLTVACGGLGNPATVQKEEQNSMLSTSGLTATVSAVSSTGMAHNVVLTIPVGGLQVRNHNQDQNPGQNASGNSSGGAGVNTEPPSVAPTPNTVSSPSQPEIPSANTVTSNPAAPGAKPAQKCVASKDTGSKAKSESSNAGKDKTKPANDCTPHPPAAAKKSSGSSGSGNPALRARL
ncbi:MAG: choice-of-anchor D domain-containing protein, partial [Terriglobales bacterium]